MPSLCLTVAVVVVWWIVLASLVLRTLYVLFLPDSYDLPSKAYQTVSQTDYQVQAETLEQMVQA